MDRTHNPEFTVLELYVAYKDYNWMMGAMENLIVDACNAVHGTTKATLAGTVIDFTHLILRLQQEMLYLSILE